jgi:hypothetical protein
MHVEIYRIASTLYHMYETCLKTLTKRNEAFMALTNCYPRDWMARWQQMDDQPKLVDGAIISVYEARFGKGTLANLLDSNTFTCLLSSSNAVKGLP